MSSETKVKTQNGNTPNPVSAGDLETVTGGGGPMCLTKPRTRIKTRRKKSKRRKEAK